MLAVAFGDRGRPKEFGLVERLDGKDSPELKFALCQRAGLIKRDHVDLGELFHSGAAFHHDSRAGQPGHRSHDRARCGEDQRTRAGDHQNAERRQKARSPFARADSPADQRERGRAQHDRQEEAGVPIGRSFQRCFLLGGFGDQLNDSRERCVLADFRCFDFQRAELVHRSSKDARAGFFFNREALTGEGAFIDTRIARRNGTVDGDSLAGADDDGLSDLDLGDRHFRFAAVDENSRGRRAKVEDASDGLLSPVDCVTLDAFSAERDEDDQSGGRVLAQNDRGKAGDRQCQVGSNFSVEQTFECPVKNPRSAKNRREQRETEAGELLILTPAGHAGLIEQPDQNVGSEENRDGRRQQVNRRRAVMKTAPDVAGRASHWSLIQKFPTGFRTVMHGGRILGNRESVPAACRTGSRAHSVDRWDGLE